MTVIIDVHIQAIHHIEMRIRKQLFHGGIFDLGRYFLPHIGAEVGIGGEAVDIVERGRVHRLGRGLSSNRCHRWIGG